MADFDVTYEDDKQQLKTESTPDAGATKIAQVLLRRKTASQWEAYDQEIPLGEPCFSYDPTTGDCVLKIGFQDLNGNQKLWGALNLLRGRVDDGELK